MEMIGGIIVVGLALMAIGCMMCLSWQVVLDSMKADERHKNKLRVMLRADRLYSTMLRNTEYKVKMKPIRIVNESDIDWGNDQEVLL